MMIDRDVQAQIGRVCGILIAVGLVLWIASQFRGCEPQTPEEIERGRTERRTGRTRGEQPEQKDFQDFSFLMSFLARMSPCRMVAVPCFPGPFAGPLGQVFPPVPSGRLDGLRRG